jgi:hypothetical protein
MAPISAAALAHIHAASVAVVILITNGVLAGGNLRRHAQSAPAGNLSTCLGGQRRLESGGCHGAAALTSMCGVQSASAVMAMTSMIQTICDVQLLVAATPRLGFASAVRESGRTTNLFGSRSRNDAWKTNQWAKPSCRLRRRQASTRPSLILHPKRRPARTPCLTGPGPSGL